MLLQIGDNVRIAAESKAKLAIIPTKVTIEYSVRVNPSDNFIA